MCRKPNLFLKSKLWDCCIYLKEKTFQSLGMLILSCIYLWCRHFYFQFLFWSVKIHIAVKLLKNFEARKGICFLFTRWLWEAAFLFKYMLNCVESFISLRTATSKKNFTDSEDVCEALKLNFFLLSYKMTLLVGIFSRTLRRIVFVW